MNTNRTGTSRVLRMKTIPADSSSTLNNEMQQNADCNSLYIVSTFAILSLSNLQNYF